MLSALVLAGVGVLGGMVISLVVSGIQVQAPPALRGRVMSMYAITSQVLPALSGVAAGVLVGRSACGRRWRRPASRWPPSRRWPTLAMPVLRRHPGR